MLSYKERILIANEIIRRIDTVSLCTCSEVRKIRDFALEGLYDDMLNILFSKVVSVKTTS